MSSIAFALGTEDQEIDIQNDLGKIGTETHKFECYLFTPEYEKYRYRMFFVKYNVSNYPVTVVFEDSVAQSIKRRYASAVLLLKNGNTVPSSLAFLDTQVQCSI